MKAKEGGNILVIIIGIILILFLVGFFRSGESMWSKFNFKQVLRLPCGLTLVIPADSTSAPQYFTAWVKVIAPPHTDTGNLLITSTTGLLRAIPVKF